MNIFTNRQAGAPAGYESGSIEVDVAAVAYPAEAQVVWKDPTKHSRQAIRIINNSAVAVTAKIEKKITFTAGEPGLPVESGGLKEFPIPANDEIIINFELISSELAIFLKAPGAAQVTVYLAGKV